ncbi:MAG: 4-hydroxy-tetrahydrodipicolinate synthase [Deltaproteobacteria bacterium]|nr:4-hydroxy-tetrahydrodipicolinate synthase [Deltaproteobacteria bacterium]
MSPKSFQPTGLYPALVTPFEKDGAISEEKFRRLIRFCLPHVDGLVPCGTTGEFPYLDPGERRRLIEIAVQEAGGKPVIAGTGAESTRKTIELTQLAKEAGAAASLIVTPYFLHPSDKGLYQHYYEVARAVDLPIILYNIPQLVDAYLPRRVVEDLADIPSIVGIKDSSGNLAYTMEILEYAGDRITVLVGHDEVVLNALAGGVEGMILASAQVYPEIWQQVRAAVKAGDLAEARRLQGRVQKLSRIFCRLGGGVAVKQALKMMGIDAGFPRLPLKPVGGALIHEDRAEIQLELEKLGKTALPAKEHTVPQGPVIHAFESIGLSAQVIKAEGMKCGRGQAGVGMEAVQVDLVCGAKNGQMGEVWAYQLTYPRYGFEALTTILEPNLTVRPSTLIISTNELKDLRQANMIYGPVQNGVAQAVVDKLAQGVIGEETMHKDLLIVQAAVHPRALDRHSLHTSTYHATLAALDAAFSR